MEEIEPLLTAQSDKLFFYSPYNFIQGIDREAQYQKLVAEAILQFSQDHHNQVIEIEAGGYRHYFYVAYLPWDSNYFKIPTYKIFFVLCQHTYPQILSEAVVLFRKTFMPAGKIYCFLELPSEDILLLQSFTHAGFKLIETRLVYYLDGLQHYKKERYQVRKADRGDIQNLKKIAAETRNFYDRVHADPFFAQETADVYLATYIEQAVEGFADVVLVPDEKDIPVDAFSAISYLENDSQKLNCHLSRILLTAVAPSCRGWHYKLVSESVYQAKSTGAQYMLMTTQSTNRAVIRNCEKLGFRFGAATHILSAYSE